jgi:3-hydroxyethyl bacteriochlorophyllide a dehydrogenase
MKARTILFTAVNQVALGETELPDPGPEELLIQAHYTCISPGTELRCLAGLQDGAPDWPFIPGYALTGEVIARGSGTTLPVGTPVLCAGTLKAEANRLWGGHVSHAVQREAAVFPIPEGVDLLDASVARLAAIAYHGLRMSRPLAHEQVAVVGLGAIGQLAARLHAMTGAPVVAADLSANRVEIARAAGIEAFVPKSGLLAGFRDYLPDGADILVEATGNPGVLPEAIPIAREQPYDDSVTPGARLLLQASYPGEFSIPYQAAFRRELQILIPRDRQPRDMRTALDLIRTGRLQVRDLVTEVRPPEDAPEIYQALREARPGLITAAFRWS